MINTNALLLCDTYKCVHHKMYNSSLKALTSYWVPRKSMFKNQENQKMVFFGLQSFIQEYLIDYFKDNFFDVPINDVIDTYQHYLNIQLGTGNYEIDHLKELHELGYLPLHIEALPEGSLVNMGVPCICVTNTDYRFAWLVQWIECLMQAELWKICNHATIGNMYYRLAKKWYEKTVDDTIDPRNAFSDFGMRGMSGMQEAMKCSAAWLLSSNKTSTIAALPYIDKYYDADCSKHNIGIGAISTEHSVMSSNYAIDGDEITFVKRLLTELYPNVSFSMVSDTYDYWNMIENILPSCREEIMSHNGTLFVRPDSGDQVQTVIRTIKKLWDVFGGSLNTKGYKLLTSKIRVILGDGSTLSTVEKIWTQLESDGFASNNVIFGVGAFCFSAIFENDKLIVNTRDTFGLAQKTTHGQLVEKEIFIFKDPKTDTDNLKKSHKGLVFVEEVDDEFIHTDNLSFEDYFIYQKTHINAMRAVFNNGTLLNKEDFTTIRERLEKYS